MNSGFPRPATLIPLVALLAGLQACGSPKKQTAQQPANPAPTTAPETEPRAVQVEDANLTQRDEQRKVQWKLKSESALLTYAEGGKAQGELTTVRGELYQKDQLASTFESEKGFADQRTSDLRLVGEVAVTSKEQGLVLSAETVRWIPGRELIEAKGAVEIRGADYRIGPFPVLLATPDLKQFGTPDRFPGTSQG